MIADAAHEGDKAWMADALCTQTDPDAFFPEQGGSLRQVRKICGACPVQPECLEYALSHDMRDGVWAGLSQAELRSMRRDRS